MRFGSRNPIYLNMSFCGVLLVFLAFCYWMLQLNSEPVLGSSLFTALHPSLLQQPMLCGAVCTHGENSADIRTAALEMLLAYRGRTLSRTGACGWPQFTLLCVPSRGQDQALRIYSFNGRE